MDCNLRASKLYRLANAGDYGFAWCLSNLGRLLFLFGEDGAEEVLAESRRIGEQASGLHSPAYARLLCFDQFFTVSGDLEKADELVSFSASTLLEHLGEGPDYAWAMANCAVLFAFQGDWAEARRANEDCARINDRAVKTCKHTYSFTSKNNELVFDFIDNRPVKASFDQLLSDASEELGPRHPYVANVIANRGFVESIDDPEEGARSILRAAGILDDAIKPDCPDALYLKLCASLLSQDAPLSSTAASALKEAAASDMVISALLGERPAARPAVQLARNNGAELYLTPFSLANRQTDTTLSHY